VTVADAVYSGGVALHGYESTAFYKLSQVIFAAFFDVVLFALTILIFALETISSPAFPEQAFAMVNFDPVSTVLAFFAILLARLLASTACNSVCPDYAELHVRSSKDCDSAQ
jgi:fumarate reductase subunit C